MLPTPSAQFAPEPITSSRKEEILDAARHLISERGYLATSMRDLAEALSIKPASLYSHYRAKEDMLWEIALRCATTFHERVLPLAQLPLPASERLHRMLQAHVATIIELRDASAIFFREWRNLEETRRTAYSAHIKTYELGFTRVIEAGIAAGEFREVQPTWATYSLLSSANWVQRWYKPDRGASPGSIAQEIADFGLGGLRKPPAART